MGSTDSDDDSHNSTDAVVMKRRSIQDQGDVLSVRSMPLMRDDDYFYYHGGGGKDDDDDDEVVDHIGLLIGGPAMLLYPAADTPSASTERDFRTSLRSFTSEVTYGSEDQDKPHYTTQEYVEMKLQIADLKAQLDDQQFQSREKYNATISSLRDRIMMLECENTELKQKLKEAQADALRGGGEARRVQHRLEVKARLRQVQLNQDSKEDHYDQSTRGSSTSSEDLEDMSNYSEGEDFLPFPEFSDRTRSRLVSSFRASGRRASLLDSFRSFRRSANSSRGSEDLTDLDNHYSWANADEINAQTGIFNKKSISKLLEDAAKRGCFESEKLPLSVSLHDTPICSREEPVQPPRRKLKSRRERRQTFTLGENARPRRASFKDLLSINREEQGIDVESELWDNFVENNENIAHDDASIKSGSTDYGTVRTAGW